MPRRTKPLSPMRAAFCQHLVADEKRRIEKAALAAGYTPNVARHESYKLLNDPVIVAEIDRLDKARLKRLQRSQDETLTHINRIAYADPNELVEHRRVCCRYCYGEGFQYQRTPQERREAEKAWTQACLKATDTDPVVEWDEMGGIGFNATKPPHPDCPECFGLGVSEVFLKDTRDLSEDARVLYAGAKISATGKIEVLTKSQDQAIGLLAKHHGLVKDRVELTGKDGEPIKVGLGHFYGESGKADPQS